MATKTKAESTGAITFSETERPEIRRGGRPKTPNPYLPVAERLAQNRSLTLGATVPTDAVKNTLRLIRQAGAEQGVTIRSNVEEREDGTATISLWAVDRIVHKPHQRAK